MTEGVGERMYGLAAELYPICRSITGEGVRQTLRRIAAEIPLMIQEVPSGTPVFDWVVPREWGIREAYVADTHGKRLIDFREHNLHVLNYSAPIHRRMPLSELRPHLYTLPEQPDLIPYRTSYYAERWGFCLAHNELKKWPEGEYEVCIDSSLKPGSLTYGECYLAGSLSDEILVSCHVCHPSLANDNLSGIAVAAFLAKTVQGWSARRYSYRFLFIPGTIGSITWLARNEAGAGRVKHGLVLSCVGDAGHCTYKKSRRGNAEVDRAVVHVLTQAGSPFEVVEFTPYGYDERQYCSPGFNLPVGCFMRTPNGRYPEYHTSADNLELIKPHALADSYKKLGDILFALENNRTYLNQNPKCEPQLGKRGLYQSLGGSSEARAREMALLWVLNLSDGNHSLLQIAERARTEFALIKSAADALLGAGLLLEVAPASAAAGTSASPV